MIGRVSSSVSCPQAHPAASCCLRRSSPSCPGRTPPGSSRRRRSRREDGRCRPGVSDCVGLDRTFTLVVGNRPQAHLTGLCHSTGTTDGSAGRVKGSLSIKLIDPLLNRRSCGPNRAWRSFWEGSDLRSLLRSLMLLCSVSNLLTFKWGFLFVCTIHTFVMKVNVYLNT